MADMNLQDYAAMRELEHSHKDGWGLTTAVWVVVGVVFFAVLVWAWNKMNTEKTEIAVGLANVVGRVNAIEPALTAQGNSIFSLNGVVSAAVQGVSDFKECTNEKFNVLEAGLFRRSGCGSCGNREFRQSSVYNLASTNVTVDETCRN